MNPFDKLPIDLKKQEITTPDKKEIKYLGSIKKVRGLSLFCLNIRTREVKKLETKKEIGIDFEGNTITKESAFLNPEKFIPIQALNLKNAKRKAKNAMIKIKEYEKNKTGKIKK